MKALLAGRDEVAVADWEVLADVAWTDPAHEAVVRATVLAVAAPARRRLAELSGQVDDALALVADLAGQGGRLSRASRATTAVDARLVLGRVYDEASAVAEASSGTTRAEARALAARVPGVLARAYTAAGLARDDAHARAMVAAELGVAP